MKSMAQLQHLFSYDAWANRRVIESLKAASAPPGGCLKLVAHIAGAQQIWYARIEGAEWRKYAVWPELTMAQCEAELARLGANWAGLLGRTDEAGLEKEVNYTNTAGDHFSSVLHDILAHVVNHGTYHRGQVAMLLRDAGHAPAPTDYIMFVR